MQKYLVEITKIAEHDIYAIFQYIAHDNSYAAAKWVDVVEQQINSLERFPYRCSIIPEAKELEQEYRHLICGNYRTIFRIQGSKVIIMRVIHGARILNLEVLDK